MRQMRNTGHLNFNRHCNLSFNLLSTAARPLRNDLNVVVRDVWIGFNGQTAKRDNAPHGENEHSAQYQPAILKCEINKRCQHYWFPAVSSIRALLTICWPGSMPERITCRLPLSIWPGRTSMRLNLLSPAGTCLLYT